MMRRLLALAFGLFTFGCGCLLQANAQFFTPGPAMWAPPSGPAACTTNKFWSATQLNSNLTGGGTATVTQGNAASTYAPVYGQQSETSGKFYVEFNFTGVANAGQTAFGIGNTSSSIASGQYLGIGADTLGVFLVGTSSAAAFTLFTNGANVWMAATPSPAASWTDRFAMAVDITNRLFWLRDVTVNSQWYGVDNSSVGVPSSGTNGYNFSTSITANPVVAAGNLYETSATGTIHAPNNTWSGAAPAGFGQMCS